MNLTEVIATGTGSIGTGAVGAPMVGQVTATPSSPITLESGAFYWLRIGVTSDGWTASAGVLGCTVQYRRKKILV